MKELLRASVVILFSIVITTFGFGFQSDNEDLGQLREMINFMVGGTWESENVNNSDNPEDFKSFYMNFENWHDQNSVRGSIYGIKNNGDTLGLMEVWNFVDVPNKNIRLLQRTIWQEHSEGTIFPYEGKHLDIRFKSTMADGQTYFTKDIHFKESPDKLRAETYHRRTEKDDWQKASESLWIRKQD
ncbi:MAG: hypothetical protein JJ971_15610 [Balneolaceae bacterium]|nr:hypothetical protein [Balneolaceae bacterium]MBO6547827.1 hypothetical protein [Balneolaceae bacterium]MBO6648338.1 hypothetical protein [Balneolaceae bacterium]